MKGSDGRPLRCHGKCWHEANDVSFSHREGQPYNGKNSIRIN